jgi:hypothetical protein
MQSRTPYPELSGKRFWINAFNASDRNSPLHLRYASTPLAASLVAKGMSPGTAFIFLLAGMATNAATITMVAPFLGKRSAALYLGVISLCALSAGFVLDWFYLKPGINAVATAGTAKEFLPEDMKLGFAILLLPLMLYGIFRSEKNAAVRNVTEIEEKNENNKEDEKGTA